jgi:hypothetical protein
VSVLKSNNGNKEKTPVTTTDPSRTPAKEPVKEPVKIPKLSKVTPGDILGRPAHWSKPLTQLKISNGGK